MRLDRRIALVTLLALTLPFLLGAERCDYENSLPWRYGKMVLKQLRMLDHRVERLEECECCCDGVLQLVCGSDGRTFVNACEARCAGVHVVPRESPIRINGNAGDSSRPTGPWQHGPSFFAASVEQPVAGRDVFLVIAMQELQSVSGSPSHEV